MYFMAVPRPCGSVTVLLAKPFSEGISAFFPYWLHWVFFAALGLSPVATSGAYSLLQCMASLNLQYFGHFMKRVDLLEKTLMLGGIGGIGKGNDRG